MKNFVLVLLLAVPFSASAVLPVQLRTASAEDAAVRALIESQVNDFDVVRDHELLEKAIDMSPLELLGEGLLHLVAGSSQILFNVRDLANPNDWKRMFKLVIWINRASRGPTAQSLQVWDEGRRVMAVRVSTGSAGRLTPTGYYSPEWLSKDHHSKLYGNTPMPYAIFFNGHVAMHERPPGTQGSIGLPASHGCVRISADGSRPAARLFSMVAGAGQGETPAFTRGGSPLREEDGTLKTRTGYRTLVIVEQR